MTEPARELLATEAATMGAGPMSETPLRETSMSTSVDAGPTAAIESPTAAAEVRSRLWACCRGSKAAVVGADAVAVSIGIGAGLWALDAAPGAHLGLAEVLLAVAALPIWLACFARRRLYHARVVDRRVEEVRRVAHGSVMAAAWVGLLTWSFGVTVPRRWVAVAVVVAIVAVLLEREILRTVFRRRRRDGQSLRRVLIAGARGEGEQLCSMLDDEPEHGYQVVGFIDDDLPVGTTVRGRPVLAGSASAVEAVQACGADTVLVASSVAGPFATNHLARALTRERIHVELTSTLQDIAVGRLTMRNLGGHPVVYLEPLPGGWRPVAKRVFDVVVAGATLLVVSPLWLIVAALIKIDSRGPVIFTQERVGRDGHRFRVFKFRTMVRNAEGLLIDLRDRNEADGPLFKLKNDPRVTRVGRVLRRMSLDELPQLWNVLRGEMSLVGPRPALPDETELWDTQLRERLRVRPGITGMWQVSGRSDASFEAYSRLDLYYVDNWSPVLDLGILLRTIPTVLFSRGAY